VAFVVRDDHPEETGSARFPEESRLTAKAVGISRLVADTLPENHPMLDVFRSRRLSGARRLEQGVVRVTLEI